MKNLEYLERILRQAQNDNIKKRKPRLLTSLGFFIAL